VKKKKPNEPVKLKSRIVACGNYDESEEEKSTYAGGADATAVRTAIRQSALKMWMVRAKDVCTAFLNADYYVEGEMLLLQPPYIYVKAGLVDPDEYWLVKKAIYGLKESPLLWSKERDRKLAKLIIKLMQNGVEEEYILKKLKSDPNTWHILKKGEEEESRGLLLTYVDDILVATTEELGEAVMKAIDQTWKCSPEEVVREGEKGVSFCGIVIEKIENGYFIHQRPYTKELLKKHKLEGCNSTKIILDRESDDEDRTFEKEQREQWYQDWVTTEEFRSKLKESQRIAGGILWLTTRTRPDLCFSIQKMSSIATKNPVKAVQYGVRMLRYLKGTEDFGLKYLTKEETM
jgi:hypothetical protein